MHMHFQAASIAGSASDPPEEVVAIPSIAELLQIHSVAAATAMVKPAVARDAALTTVAATTDAIATSTFDEDRPMFGSRLESKQATAETNAKEHAAGVAAAAKLSAEVDSEAVESIAVPSKRSKLAFERLLEAELANNPAGFAALAEFTEQINVAAGALKIGAICMWMDPAKAADAPAVKVQVAGATDPSTGLISIKVWTESIDTNKPYAEGFTTDAMASRKDLSGGVPKPKQPIPAGLLTRAEQHQWLIVEGAKALEKVVPLLRKIEAKGLKCSMQLQLLIAFLKAWDSTSRKVFGEYRGDFRDLLDLVRFTFKGMNVAAVTWVYQAVEDEPDFEIVVLKNRLDPRLPAPAGYRDTCVDLACLFWWWCFPSAVVACAEAASMLSSVLLCKGIAP